MNDRDPFDDEALTRSILARTSGDPCGAAHERLVAWADGELDAVDAELVRGHLAACADCAALVVALGRAAAELPTLCEVRPDVDLVAAVLARTHPRPSLAARIRARAVAAAEGLLRRPRIAWEAAYVGTFVLAIVFAAPVSPLAGVPERALAATRGNPIGELAEPVARVRTGLTRSAGSAWHVAAGEVSAWWVGAEAELGRGAARVREILQGLGTAAPGAASGQEQEQEREHEPEPQDRSEETER